MRRGTLFLPLLVPVILLLVLPTLEVLAQRPDLLREYRFHPWRSTLDVSGGLAGVHVKANIFGNYGFVTGVEQSPLAVYPPILIPFAKFVDVQAKAVNSTGTVPDSFDLDKTLNLSGLRGEPLPVYFPAVMPNIEVYKFTGRDGQGAPMKLYSLVVGRWMYLRGANSPGCCDLFNYEIKALARQMPFADLNADDAVDQQDLGLILGNYGSGPAALTDGTLVPGDVDGNGHVNGLDLLAWQRERGESTPPLDFDALLNSILASLPELKAVPEPGTWLLLATAMVGWLTPRRQPHVG